MRVRFCFAFLLLSGSAWAAAFTQTTSGDWNTPATWGNSGSAVCHTTIPCMTDSGNAGDTVTMPDGLTLTCGTGSPETCSVGSSPAVNNTIVFTQSHTTGTGTFSIGAGSTFIYAGSVSLFTGNFSAGAGATIQYDSSWSSASTTVGYYWQTHNVSFNPMVWNFSGTSGSHITWQGDSFSSPNADPGICAQFACEAGSVNYIGASPQNDVGQGSLTYLDVENIAGLLTGATPMAWYFAMGSTNSAFGNITLNNVTFTGSGTVKFLTTSTNGVNNFTANSLAFSNCTSTATNGGGCVVFGANASGNIGAGTYVVTGMTIDGRLNVGTQVSGDRFLLRNVMTWGSSDGFFPNQAAGFFTIDGITVDQMFVYDNTWFAGGTDSNINAIIPVNVSNSLWWLERTSPASTHVRFLHNFPNDMGTSGSASVTNTVVGTMGTHGSNGTGASTTGGVPPVATTFLWSGNVELCGFDGNGTTQPLGGYFTGTTSGATITQTGNTLCNLTNVSGNQPTNGAYGFETATIASGTMASIDSNLLFCAVSGGCNMSSLQGPNDASASPTSVTFMGGNAAFNVNIYTQQYVTNNFVQTLGTDQTFTGRIPVMVEPNRSVPLFDTEYLIPSGLLPLTTYTGAAQWKGAWTASTSYVVGDLVSFSDPTAFGGKTTYWRCVQANTAGATNEPILAVDASNPFRVAAAYWEEAYLQFLRQQVVANTIYDAQCGGLASVSCPSPHTYIVGLLNAWLRQGVVTMEPALWTGCLNGNECGAVSLAAIRHLPPAAMTF